MNAHSEESIWESLRESFDDKLPRRTAVALKPSDSTILYAYPMHSGAIGWSFDDRTSTSYDDSPSYELFVAPWTGPGFIAPLSRSTFVWESRNYCPDLVQRSAAFSEPGIRIRESFGRAVDNAFTWQLDVDYLGIHAREKSLYVALRASSGLGGVQVSDRCFDLGSVTVCADANSWGAFDSLDDAEAAIGAGGLSGHTSGSRYLVLEFKVSLKRNEGRTLSVGLSFGDPDAARQACEVADLDAPIRERWDSWFRSLPSAEFASPEERRAYYKCWWVVKLNYYQSPRFGHMVCEALPVYRGYWLWGLDSSEWHSDQNTEYTSVHIRQALDLFLDHQREDGFITHAIYLTEQVPGENWARRSITQTPHIPWVCLRYADVTGDCERLRAWYPKLVRFYNYLCESRDACFRDLHLWGIIASFDTGLDTTPAFEKVTYGVDGVKEGYCYPAIFAAERCRYEQSLARMSEILGTDEPDHWLAESEKTRKAMDEILWDSSRNWYGVLHEDGTLDTRVGVDGLFPFAYGLVSPKKASAAKDNFRRLIGRYGIHTVAPGELEYEADHYWRGPAWPKSCAMGVVAARNYYPDLREEAVRSTIRMLLRWPSVWECMNAETGDAARADQGMVSTPLISSNVGSGEALGMLLTVRGVDMMSFDGTLPLSPVTNFHWAGFRLDVAKSGDRWSITIRPAERSSGELRIRLADGSVQALNVEAGKTYAM